MLDTGLMRLLRDSPSGLSFPPDTHYTFSSAFRLCQARCCQPPPGGASCSCPRFCLVPHPLTPSPGGTLWTILCMDQHVRWLLCCSRMDNAPAIRTPWAVAPPMHPSTHQGLCHSSQPPFSGLARLRPLNPPGPRLPLTATLSPFHKAPCSLRPAWILGKPSGVVIPGDVAPPRRHTQDNRLGFHPPPTPR